MNYVIGVAPSRKSVRDENGKAVPWCSAADCEMKVRLLIGDAPLKKGNQGYRTRGKRALDDLFDAILALRCARSRDG